MAEQQVFATKGNLILYKKALKLAALGYEKKKYPYKRAYEPC